MGWDEWLQTVWRSLFCDFEAIFFLYYLLSYLIFEMAIFVERDSSSAEIGVDILCFYRI